jgi:hypothetical protein
MEGLNREFVIYPLSSRMKALGFDEPCLAWFVSEEHGLEIGEVVKSDLIKEGILAPTYSQAFRWFREKYDLLHSIIEYNKDGSLIIEISQNKIEIFRKMTYFNITEYEEAELACLEKLIEIVESKTK